MEKEENFPAHMTPLFNMGSYTKKECDTCSNQELCTNQDINFESDCEDWKPNSKKGETFLKEK